MSVHELLAEMEAMVEDAPLSAEELAQNLYGARDCRAITDDDATAGVYTSCW